MTTYTIKRGRKTSRATGSFTLMKRSVRKTVTFTHSCMHDVVHSSPGDLFGIQYSRGAAIKFCWEFDHRFQNICIIASKTVDHHEDRYVIGFVNVGEEIKMDIMLSDTYVVFSVLTPASISPMSKFVPFDFRKLGFEIMPSFPVKAPHDIEIIMD